MPVIRQNLSAVPARPYTVVRGGLHDAAAPRAVDGPDVMGPLGNRLLAALPRPDFERLLPYLEPVELDAGDVLYEYGVVARHVYFPVTALVALMYESADGASSQVAAVGREGMVGVGLFLSGENLPGLAQVQCAGRAFRLCARHFRDEIGHAPGLEQTLHRYTLAAMTEIAQNAVCSQHHGIGSQLCRCLLRSVDAMPGDEVLLTHEMLAAALGVRRECVTVAAGKLRRQGLIDYRRGHVRILNRAALEASACECHGIVTRAFDRLLAPQRIGLAVPVGLPRFERAVPDDRARRAPRPNHLRALK